MLLTLHFLSPSTPPKKTKKTKIQGVKVIKTYAERMRGEGVRRAIVVAGAPLTPFARQCLAEMAPRYQVREKVFFFEFFFRLSRFDFFVVFLLSKMFSQKSSTFFLCHPPYHSQVEVFQEQELLINVTHHVLVPPHTVLSSEEKAALLRRYRVREAQLPRIQFNDPVARYHGLARGQVVRIVRPSETAGRYVTYRLCV